MKSQAHADKEGRLVGNMCHSFTTAKIKWAYFSQSMHVLITDGNDSQYSVSRWVWLEK